MRNLFLHLYITNSINFIIYINYTLTLYLFIFNYLI
nr:MAG TPA: hypothetical protein [Caudoviricetes sp.]